MNTSRMMLFTAPLRPSEAPRSTPVRVKLGRVPDLIFRGVCRGAALLIVILFGILVAYLFAQSLASMKRFGWAFFTTNEWDPRGNLGALPFIYGTLVTSAIAMIVAVPLGIGTAAFLAEIASGQVRRIGSFLIELLAAIPSVVYGLWGYYFLVPPVGRLFEYLGAKNVTGMGLLSAGLILAIMIVPYITAIAFDVCRAVPRSQREGALALGATRWQVIWSVILPYAKSGIVGGCFLALGRALGETMAVVMLIGNVDAIEVSLFGKGSTIASVIANKLNEAQSNLDRSALVELALILLLVSIAVNCLARLLLWQTSRGRIRMPFLSRLFPPKRIISADSAELTAKIHTPLKGKNKKAAFMNGVMTAVLGGCLAITLGPLFLILGYISYRGLDALGIHLGELRHPFSFSFSNFFAPDLNFFIHLPSETPPGLGHAIYGSTMMVGLATVFAVPIGLLAAIFLAEFRTSKLAPVVRFIAELLGGVPSIVIGIFGYALLVLPFERFSGWAGVFCLGLMMTPIVIRASEEALKLVPSSLRYASYALGAAQWQTVLKVTVPAALPAIITAIFLAIARIAGETAPLLLTAGSTNFRVTSPNRATSYLTYYIYNFSQMSDVELQRLAWAAAFVLLALVMFLNIGIRLATGKRVVLAARAD